MVLITMNQDGLTVVVDTHGKTVQIGERVCYETDLVGVVRLVYLTRAQLASVRFAKGCYSIDELILIH